MCVCVYIPGRYSAVRKQFGPSPDVEFPVIEYQLQVYRQHIVYHSCEGKIPYLPVAMETIPLLICCLCFQPLWQCDLHESGAVCRQCNDVTRNSRDCELSTLGSWVHVTWILLNF